MSRRALLAGGALLAVGVAGSYVDGVPGGLPDDGSEQVSLSIKTVPADADEPATRIARHLATNLQAVGVDANVVLKEAAELRRDVLQRNAFDLYVDRLPLAPDPDALRPLLGSSSIGRTGWHNPFGYADDTIDDLLAAQRRTAGVDRRGAVGDLLREVATKQPLVPVAVPNDVGAVRTDRFGNWQAAPLHSPLRYLGVRHRGPDVADRLDVAVTDGRITRNLNPLSARFRDRGTITGLLYEPLGRRVEGTITPWLAREWTWIGRDAGQVEVTLRPDLRWHDGEPLTATDVGFTYRFLQDTSLGGADEAVPAPRLHGRASLVERVESVDRRTVRLGFGDTPAPVARRALTAPILPRHVWEPTAVETEPVGVDVADTLTEAIVRPNPEPVGSGPLRFRDRVVEEVLVLERFDDHFLHRDADRPIDGLDYRELHFRVAPAAASAVELAENGDVDGTTALTDPGVVPQIGRASPLTLTVNRAPVLYHVGFNTRRSPFGDAGFRRVLARFLDKGNVARSVFRGYASPVGTPYAGTAWTPPALTWRDSDPEVPFLGREGELDVEAAREQLAAVGYESEDGVVIEP